MKRVLSFMVGAAALLVAGAASSAEVCIEQKAKDTLSACAGGGPKAFDVSAHGKAPQVNFHSAPPPADLKKRDQQTKPNQPGINEVPRDERKSRLQARQRALLVTEIQGIERLFETTAKNAPDRPTLARRLAEDYVELESAAFRDKTKAEEERDALKKTNAAEAGKKQTAANQADQVLKAARGKAIANYSLIKNEYPNYPQLDEVLYYLAYEYEQGSDYKQARNVYYELINKAPQSKYIPNAYLAFGELFFNEAQGDPSKFELAAKAYIEVIKYPPPNNKVYGYAFYKLAYVYWNTGELDKSMNAFKKTIDYGTAYSQLPGASKLGDSARRDIIPVYALKGDPARAYDFFKGISGDQGGNEKTFKMMDDLGNNYLDTGHYPEAILLFRDLLKRDAGSAKTCGYQAHITEAVMAMKSGNKDIIKAELDNQMKTFTEFKNGNFNAEAKAECANKTAALFAETAMAYHLEAVGSGGQRGTGDQKTMTLATYLYKKVADTWTADEFGKFQFPRVQKEDWPNIYKIRYAMADLLYFQERWAECGPAFDAVVAENPQAAEAPEAAYASVLCYQKIYDQTHAKGEAKKGSGNLPGQGKKDEKKTEAESEKLKPKEFTDSQKGMIQAFNRYICYIKPPEKDAEGQNQLVEVKYARARTYFEGQHWEEAGYAFRDIALNNSDRGEVGIYAAQLYLESINVLGSHMQPARPGCFDDMAVDVPKFIELYCTADKAAKNAEQCTNLNKVQVDLLRLKAEKLVERAGKEEGTGALKDFEDAGNGYSEMFRRYCQDPVSNKQKPQADRCDEIIYNAAKAYQAARLISKAMTARQALLRFDGETGGGSPLAKKAVYEIGGNWQAIAVYDMAAQWFEQYAKADSKADKADLALSDAVLLRLGLGQENEAIEDARIFQRNYGAAKPAQTAAIAFAIGAHYVEKEEWDKARGAFAGSMGTINKAAPDIQVQAHGAYAHALSKLHHPGLDHWDNEAKGEYKKVRELWANPAESEQKIKAAYPGEEQAQTDKRLARTLNAVGEAFFEAAEDARMAQVETLKFPEYKGSGDKKDEVLKHINTKVKEWYEKKKLAIEKVEPEYVKILELKPVPPPKWVIAAGSRSGLMWGGLVDDFRRAPYPKQWDQKGFVPGTGDTLSWNEVKLNYFNSLDQASEPFKANNAKPALKKCLDLSVKYQFFDEFSRACEVWLAKNYKGEYHVVDELRGAPTLSNSGLDERSPPVLVGGSFWHPPAATADKSATDDGKGKDKDKDTGKPAAKPPAGKKK